MRRVVTPLMRALVTCSILLLPLVGGAGAVHAQTLPQPDCTATPLVLCKKVRIYNNDPKQPVYLVFVRGPEAVDNWLVALSGTSSSADNFPTTQVYRYYIKCCTGNPSVDGIQPGHFVEVTIPFYTQLKSSANPTTDKDVFADWFNGNRIYLYDDYAQISERYNTDTQQGVIPTPVTAAPCITIDGAGTCFEVQVFKSPTGFPAGDRAQLTEYTFAAAITGPTRPYPLLPQLIGYNISYVDQVYLPLTMQPLNNPIPFIGTNASSLQGFRDQMRLFLKNYTGWPIYAATDWTRPRIPGPNVIFADVGTIVGGEGPKGNLDLTTNPSCLDCGPTPNDGYNNNLQITGSHFSDMRDTLYKACIGTPYQAFPAYCQTDKNLGEASAYKYIVNFFMQNYNNYLNLRQNGKCLKQPDGNPQPSPSNPAIDANQFLSKLYGWVPYNEGCPGENDLFVVTAGGDRALFNKIQKSVYILRLQYPFDTNNCPSGAAGCVTPGRYSFNPYAQLIHSSQYLNMTSAYAFSVDDFVGFLQFIGDGLIVTFGPGCTGLQPCRSLNRNERVVLTLGPIQSGVPEWASASFNCNIPYTQRLDLGPVVEFYPQNATASTPCLVTAKDLKGKQYQLNVVRPIPVTGTPPGPELSVTCAGVTPQQIFSWCSRSTWPVLVDTDLDQLKVGITTPPILPDNNTHDFNGDGWSDILFRNAINGQLQVWLQRNGGAPLVDANVGPLVPLDWQVVGQRDFNKDGNYDILWKNGTTGQLDIWFLNGATAFDGWSPSSNQRNYADPNWSIVGTGDFNNDGFGDILWNNSATGELRIWLLNGQTKTVLADFSPGSINPSDPNKWKLQGVGDFNSDGMSDLLWQSTVSGQVVIWLVDGTQMKVIGGGPANMIPSLDWQFQATGDFNADGKSDILFRCQTGATKCTPGQLLIWLMWCPPAPPGVGGQCTVLPSSDPKGAPQLGSGLVLKADNVTPEILADTAWQIVQTGVYQEDGNRSDNHSGIFWRNTNDGQLIAWHIIGSRTHLNDTTFNPPSVPSFFPIQSLNAN
jgi:hypothetical protein